MDGLSGVESLTEREREVLALIARGRTNAEIAETLGIRFETVKWHVSEILSKLPAGSREEAADKWRRHNGLAPRFARVFRRAMGAPAVRWVAIGGATAGVSAAFVIILVGARSDSEQPASAATTSPSPASVSPTAVATEDPAVRWHFPPPGPCPLPDSRPCTVAVELAAAMADGDMEAVHRMASPLRITCQPKPGVFDSAVCGVPRTAGDVVEAFGAGKSGGEAGVVLWEHTEEFLRSSLSQARESLGHPPEVRVGGVGCSNTEDGADCEQFAVLIVVTHAHGDQVIQFGFRYVDEVPGFYGFVNSIPSEPAVRSGKPTPAVYGIDPAWHAVPLISFIVWTAGGT